MTKVEKFFGLMLWELLTTKWTEESFNNDSLNRMTLNKLEGPFLQLMVMPGV